jgi:hypothetical protein
MATAAAAKAPVHLWIVGLASLLWGLFSAFDYIMTETGNDWYLSQLWGFNDADRAYFQGFPAAQVAGWAFGVWAALLGAVLLLMRSRNAVWALAVALAGNVLAILIQFVIAPSPTYQPSEPMIATSLVYCVIVAGLVAYAWRMWARGVLR